MLTSITPLGERGRGQRWTITASALLLGHVAGGLALGLGLAGSGWMLRAVTPAPREALVTATIAGVVLAASLFDLGGGRLPIRRQVDERWLTSYRGWVYGAGFGVQLGFGLVTVINSALMLAVVVAGVMLPAGHAVVLGVVHGVVRGVCATANGRVRTVGGLRRLHQWLDRAEGPARWATAASGAAAALGALVVVA